MSHFQFPYQHYNFKKKKTKSNKATNIHWLNDIQFSPQNTISLRQAKDKTRQGKVISNHSQPSFISHYSYKKKKKRNSQPTNQTLLWLKWYDGWWLTAYHFLYSFSVVIPTIPFLSIHYYMLMLETSREI